MADDLDANLRMALNPLGGDAESRIRDRAIQYLLEHADAAYPRVLNALEAAPNGLLAPALIDLLPRFRRPESIPILGRILTGGEESVARAAGQALGRSEGPAVTPMLSLALSSRLPETVIGAADGLLLRGDNDACPSLRKAMQLPDANVRYHVVHAAWTLGCVEDSEREVLKHDPDRSIRDLAEKLTRDGAK